jgi:hypothetical protein
MPRTIASRQIRLKPADPFDLIRLLARSQHDPRKAVCELVQNSMEAGASQIELTWLSHDGLRTLRIGDDGAGIFPELERQAALHKIVNTIGHSHKRSLSLQQRRELMMLGKYGIGLLGFWCVGRMMEIRSRVGGGETWVLRLLEDNPHCEVRRAVQRRLDEPETYTQVTVSAVHEGAARQIRPGRLQLYLASELRGQLVQRRVKLTIRDRVARGRAQKLFTVEPARFRGKRLEDVQRLAVPGHEDALLELYLLPPDSGEPGRVLLACGGSTVLDDLAALDGPEAQRAPWNSGRFEGVVDFGELTVAPGTRRGFQHDAPAVAFAEALSGLERALDQRIGEDDRQRQEQAQQNLSRHIRRAFVSVAAALPQYDLFDVRAQRRGAQQAGEEEGAALAEAESMSSRDSAASIQTEGPGDGAAPPGTESPAASTDHAGDGQLFPPGPLTTVRISPTRSRMAPETQKRFQASAQDADGRRPCGALAWSWSLHGPGALASDGSQAVYTAPAGTAEVRLEATASAGGHTATGSASVQVVEELAGLDKVSGIPEPRPVAAPLEPWRSRIRGQVWEFNSGHRDYVASCDSPAKRLRYLIHLFAKELVLHNFGGPADAALLERMVEVLTHLGSPKGPAAAS